MLFWRPRYRRCRRFLRSLYHDGSWLERIALLSFYSIPHYLTQEVRIKTEAIKCSFKVIFTSSCIFNSTKITKGLVIHRLELLKPSIYRESGCSVAAWANEIFIQKRIKKDSQSALGVTVEGISTETFLKIRKFYFFLISFYHPSVAHCWSFLTFLLCISNI